MAVLEMRLLGSFQVSIAGVSVSDFKSNKTRALLAYLAVESRKKHHRSVLASMLWPDLPEQSAMSNLRDNISFLRKCLGDRSSGQESENETSTGSRYLLVSRDTIQFNRSSDYSLDIAQFTEMVKGDQPLEVLEKALSFVEGEFLDGFSIKNSSPFEKWITLQREQIDQMVYLTLRKVADGFEKQKSYDKALQYARRQLEYMSWSEETNRQLIRLYVLTGNLKQAAIQYETFKHVLWDELGVEPDRETVLLYEQIRDGKIRHSHEHLSSTNGTQSQHSTSLETFVPEASEQSTPVVGRDAELEKLNAYLKLAKRGSGKIVFVTGDVGTGKTTIVKEFCQQALKSAPEIIAATGSTSGPCEISGLYVPIREIVQMLCFDEETQRTSSIISQEQAHRLMEFSSLGIQVFSQKAPMLVELFLAPDHPAQRANRNGSFGGSSPVVGTQINSQRRAIFDSYNDLVFPWQAEVFDQFIQAIKTLSYQNPLLLVIDDFQCADAGTVSLIHHLSRRLEGARILMICAYRSDAVGDWKNGERNAIRSLVNEIRRIFGDVVIDLNETDGKQFLNDLLDLEPNDFGSDFRDNLYALTNGNPLVAVELLADLKMRKIIIRNADGVWKQSQKLYWESLPQRLEGMIEERLSRLPENVQNMLSAASLEPDDFLPAVIASILRLDEEAVEQAMNGLLSKVCHLVTPVGLDWSGTRDLTRYRFTQTIYQVYLVNNLDKLRQKSLRAAIAQAKRALYAGNTVENETRQGVLSGRTSDLDTF